MLPLTLGFDRPTATKFPLRGLRASKLELRTSNRQPIPVYPNRLRADEWFAARTADGRPSTRKTMIVALARKLLIEGRGSAGRRDTSSVMNDSMEGEQR
jgi:hypothetical protein